MKPSPPSAPSPNPFRYGWRYVKQTTPDGQERLVEVPLTLEDVLHPQEGDVIPESDIHEIECDYLAPLLRSRVKGPLHVRITSDLLIDWDVPDQRNTSPDVAVFVGLREPPTLGIGTFHLGPSGGRCLLAVEIVSPDTRDNDVVHKPLEYHAAGVPLYVVLDQKRDGGPRTLVVYRWRAEGYERADLGEQGCVHLPFARIHLGLADGRLHCWDDATGEELGDYAAVAHQLEQADQRIAEQQHDLEVAEKAARLAGEEREKAEREARLAGEERQKAEKKAREEAQERQKAEKKAREEAQEREKAEKAAREGAEARARAEKKAREEAQERAKAEKARSDAEARAREAEEARTKTELAANAERERAVRETREVVLEVGELRFGTPDALTRAALEGMSDLDALRALRQRLRDVSSWAELLSS